MISKCLAASLAIILSSLPAHSKDNPKSMSDFALSLLHESIKDSHKNTILSPFSVSTALSMTANGAVGKTQEAMFNTLGIAGNSQKMNADNKAALDSLANISKNSTFTVANALFAKQEITFKPSFLDINKNFYQAEITTCDFENPNTLKQINNWVKTKTKNKIPSILDKIEKDDILYLLNAIYFKGQWQDPFKKEETAAEPFHLENGKDKYVKMMHKSKNMSYFAGSNFQAVYLPYSDRRLGMYIFLPNKGTTLDSLCKSLIAADWSDLATKFRSEQGYLALPIVKTDYSIELKKPLSALGMGLPFSRQADFSKMVDSKYPVYIGKVIHKTMIDINEAGTEAAAATAVSIVMESARMNPTPPFNMNVDRPYLLVLADKETHEKLFVGAIYEP